MLELIISILIALGFNPEYSEGGLIEINNQALSEIRSSERFQDLGGDEEMNKYVSYDDEDDIVGIPNVDPENGD